MTNIRRFDAQGRPVFLTAVCRNRQSLLATAAQKQLLLDVMREVKGEQSFAMLGWVVLDDHFHVMVLPATGSVISRIMQSVKLRFVRRSVRPTSATQFWQRRFWDHIVRNEDDLATHLDYIHYNPVKHGYSVRAADYPWSSFRAYVERGRYPENWAAEAMPLRLDGFEFE